jgi:hypothetical protein
MLCFYILYYKLDHFIGHKKLELGGELIDLNLVLFS